MDTMLRHPNAPTSLLRRARIRIKISSPVASAYLATVILVYMSGTSDRLLHWYVAPVWLCGVVIGVDAVDWLRGRTDVFDPFGLVGLLGFYFFFLAPLLHSYLNWWMLYVTPPQEWRDWLGWMALINLGGLFIYRFVRGWAQQRVPRLFLSQRWTLDKSRFALWLAIAMAISLALQLYVYRMYGGVLGYINSFSFVEDAFVGRGYLFVISEVFPTLALMGFVLVVQNKLKTRNWLFLGLILVVFFVMQFLFGGLRGSRANTIWTLFWAIGIVHLIVRSIPKKILLIGFVVALIFMYIYGFYKGAGVDAFVGLDAPNARVELEQRTQRTFAAMLLGDLGRSDVQALLLERIITPGNNFRYAWGRTYLGAVTLAVPRAIWPQRVPTKVKEGTEALYGRDAYDPDNFYATNVYGFAGEAMLNFGPPGVLIAFIVLGLLVGWTRELGRMWRWGDTRLLILPMLITLNFLVLVYDSDNFLFFMLKYLLIPFLIVWLGSQREPAAART